MDNERLARMEEKQDAMGRDISEVKDTIRDQNADMKATMASLLHEINKVSDRFMPTEQIQLMAKQRDKIDEEHDRQLAMLWKRVDSLSAWRYTLGGAILLLGFIIGIASHVIKF